MADGIQIREVPPDRLEEFLSPIGTALGFAYDAEAGERLLTIPEFDYRIGAWENDAVVGAAGSFSFAMTVPGGGSVQTAGLTMVGVHATHRRRGVLTQMMRRHLDDARAKGQPIAALWASEGSIYGRFGYGMASLSAHIELHRARAVFAQDCEPVATARLVDEQEGLDLFRPIWEHVRRRTPGMLTRSREWWEVRKLSDPEWARRGGGVLQRVVFEIGGELAGYALYRQNIQFSATGIEGTLDVREAVGSTPQATREVWRYLFGVDLITTIKCGLLPVDHPLLYSLAEPGQLQMRVSDALWVRLVDVEAALSQRSYAEGGGVVLDVVDEFCAWNAGSYRITEQTAKRTDYEPDVRVTAADLGALYLGGSTFDALHAAGRVEELRPGGIERADHLFRTNRAPWCPEIF